MTCVLVRGGEVTTSTQRGVKPLLCWYKAGLRGGVAADKTVGRAAAFLYVLLEADAVHANVLSRGAEEVFRAHGVPYTADTAVPFIVNRAKDGMCPMEAATLHETDPAAALCKIEAALAALSK